MSVPETEHTKTFSLSDMRTLVLSSMEAAFLMVPLSVTIGQQLIVQHGMHVVACDVGSGQLFDWFCVSTQLCAAFCRLRVKHVCRDHLKDRVLCLHPGHKEAGYSGWSSSISVAVEELQEAEVKPSTNNDGGRFRTILEPHKPGRPWRCRLALPSAQAAHTGFEKPGFADRMQQDEVLRSKCSASRSHRNQYVSSMNVFCCNLPKHCLYVGFGLVRLALWHRGGFPSSTNVLLHSASIASATAIFSMMRVGTIPCHKSRS